MRIGLGSSAEVLCYGLAVRDESSIASRSQHTETISYESDSGAQQAMMVLRAIADKQHTDTPHPRVADSPLQCETRQISLAYIQIQFADLVSCLGPKWTQILAQLRTLKKRIFST